MEIVYGKKGISSGSSHWNLEDYIMDLFSQRKVGTPEFETMLRIYGKEKVNQIFEKWVTLKEKKNESR